VSEHLDVVFTAPPGPGNEAVFVELERDGRSVTAGQWLTDEDGFARLRLTRSDLPGPASEDVLDREDLSERIAYQLADETHQHLCACDAYPASCKFYRRDDLAGQIGFTLVDDVLRVLTELGRLT